MQTTEKQPLILTLRFDAVSQAFFNKEREQHFPLERNYLKAHLTLFHQLPDDIATRIYLERLQHTSFKVEVTGLMNLGAGVAYRVESAVLIELRKNLVKRFANSLIPQDKQGFRPHITIQNKVTPQQAKALLADKAAEFQPFQIEAIGLDLWTYLGGPWRHEAFYEFEQTNLEDNSS